MLKEMTQAELMEVKGGTNFTDALVGTLEIAGGIVVIGSSGFTGIAGATGGAFFIADGIQRIFGE